MKQLTIKQAQYITGWSYPTALRFAKEHGEYQNGIWLIPEDNIADVVYQEVMKASKMEARLVSISNERDKQRAAAA